jgi:hypothetical protein
MKTLIFLLLFLSQVCGATVSVAFFRMYTPTDQVIQLEPGGQFFHVAIQLADGKWVHSHPYKGVEIVSRLDMIGVPTVVLTKEQWPSVSEEQVKPYLGLPFDFTYNWTDAHSSYCAKLIGNLLHLEPLAMSFAGEYWQGREHLQSGVGLSPDDIYAILKAMGFSETAQVVSCKETLKSPFMSLLKSAK